MNGRQYPQLRCHNRRGKANARTELIKVALADTDMQSIQNRHKSPRVRERFRFNDHRSFTAAHFVGRRRH
jgi:hypothetical protein